jgi:hypothetical protein
MNMNMNPNLDYIKPKGLPNNTHSKNSPLSLGKPGKPWDLWDLLVIPPQTEIQPLTN